MKELIDVYYDMHIHTCLSACGCSENTVLNVFEKCKENGLDLISITDHNSSLHYKAIEKLKDKYPFKVIYGMEVTTHLGFHVLFYFETLDKLNKFSEFVISQVDSDMPNTDDVELITDEFGKVVREVNYKINQPIKCSYDQLAKVSRSLDGLIVLAHVNRGGSGILEFYSDITPFDFDAIEISKNGNLSLNIEDIQRDLFLKYPYLKQYKRVYNSDGHSLDRIHKRINSIKVYENSFDGFRKWLKD